MFVRWSNIHAAGQDRLAVLRLLHMDAGPAAQQLRHVALMCGIKMLDHQNRREIARDRPQQFGQSV